MCSGQPTEHWKVSLLNGNKYDFHKSENNFPWQFCAELHVDLQDKLTINEVVFYSLL